MCVRELLSISILLNCELLDRTCPCFCSPFLCLSFIFKEPVYFLQTVQVVERVDMSNEHPLALLAEELKKLLKRESVTFLPVLSQRHPQATVVSGSLVHKLYGLRLVSVYMGCLYIHIIYSDHIVEYIFKITENLFSFFQKPFLDAAEHLTEDVISVFPAAESLEQFIMALITSACHEENAEILLKKLNLYQVRRLNCFLEHAKLFLMR